MVNNNRLSDDEALNKAKEYISEYLNDEFDLSSMKLVLNSVIDHGAFIDRSIEFKKFKDDIDTGNSIMVRLTIDGQLISISTNTNKESAVNDPINILVDDAKKIAYSKVIESIDGEKLKSSIKGNFEDYKYTLNKMVFNDTLVWKIDINGVKLYADCETKYTIMISCATGEVVFISRDV